MSKIIFSFRLTSEKYQLIHNAFSHTLFSAILGNECNMICAIPSRMC